MREVNFGRDGVIEEVTGGGYFNITPRNLTIGTPPASSFVLPITFLFLTSKNCEIAEEKC